MPEFMERLSQFAGEADQIRNSVSLATTSEDTRGYSRQVGRRDPRFMQKSLAVAQLVSDVYEGNRPLYHLTEAMTTSDFPLLFGDNLYRLLLGQYKTYEPTYPKYTKIVELKDFRALNMFTIDGGTGMLPLIEERTEYPEVKFVEGKTPVKVAKYGERFALTFEMMVNDDLNAFRDRIGQLARGARMTEEKLATSQFVGVNGPSSTLYTVGNKNIIPSNPPLSISGLQAAFTTLASQVNLDGQPIVIEGVELVVPPALMITAQNIMNATELRINADGGGTAGAQLVTVNWMKSRIGLSVNPFIPLTAGANGNTSWFLFANPNSNERPAIVMAFLQGRRNPQMFIKDSNQRMIGGQLSDPMEGDFETDSIDYKIRHFMGSTLLDFRATVSSNGSGV